MLLKYGMEGQVSSVPTPSLCPPPLMIEEGGRNAAQVWHGNKRWERIMLPMIPPPLMDYIYLFISGLLLMTDTNDYAKTNSPPNGNTNDTRRTDTWIHIQQKCPNTPCGLGYFLIYLTAWNFGPRKWKRNVKDIRFRS